MKTTAPLAAALALAMTGHAPETPSLALARDAGAWILAQGPPAGLDLYHGAAGVVWFLCELGAATGDPAVARDARDRADALVAALEGEADCGLYSGLGGVGFALRRAFELTGEPRYRDGARRAAALIRQRAVPAGSGIEWPGQGYDVISGSAGIGLHLLWEARKEGDPASRELAEKAGRRLLELGIPAGSGTKWAAATDTPMVMPNFSHGTAGVAYFLATLGQETGRREFLDAALGGARYLTSIARTAGDTALVYHHEGDGEDLYYWSWCHGPAGTARLFYRLYAVTGDCAWLEWAQKGARALLASGLPESEPPGWWDNVGPCCGHAGVAELLLGLGEPRHLELARRITAYLSSRATCDAEGARWVQAEHRVHPELREAQTGYMQGAAGVGMWLLRADALERGTAGPAVLPDSPF